MKSNPIDQIQRLMDSRRRLLAELPPTIRAKSEEEGGCGVTGFACTIPVAGRHIFTPSVQMHNRGNGKGGGIAAVGLVPEEVGVSREVLSSHYLIQIALLDATVHAEVERRQARQAAKLRRNAPAQLVRVEFEVP